MSGENAAVFGTFTGRASMEVAVDRLTAAGFSSGDISILMSDKEGLNVRGGGWAHPEEPLAFWQALAPWPYPVLGRSLLPARLSQVSPAGV